VTTGRSTDPAEWGRVDADGTVYVRTAQGERTVGSWKAGDASAALAFFGRRYEDIAAEVGLLETRFASGKADATHTLASAQRIRTSLDDAKVVGDLDALATRLTALESRCNERHEADRAAKAARAAANTDTKRALVEEAEQLAQSTQWKSAGDRLREIATGWRDIRVDRRTDNELWARLRTARTTFTKRRTQHFAEVAQERDQAAQQKEKLVKEAEGLAESSDWKPTAARLKSLMREWKAIAHASREDEAALWERFRAAQDAFFSRLSAVNAERDAAAREGQEAREKLLTEAEAIDPSAGLAEAQAALRNLQDRWEKAPRAPRDIANALDERLAAVSRKVRDVVDAQWRESAVENSPLVIRLRESVAKLERKIERARADGREKDVAEVEATLTTQREWLAQAERGG
jgi:hypothetical protein